MAGRRPATACSQGPLSLARGGKSRNQLATTARFLERRCSPHGRAGCSQDRPVARFPCQRRRTRCMLAHGRRFLFLQRAPAVNPRDQQSVAEHLLERVRQVQIALAWAGPPAAGYQGKFADLLDSMGLVEFLLQLAEDYGTTPEIIEQVVNRQFGTIRELADALIEKGLAPARKSQQPKTMLKPQTAEGSA